MPKIKENLSYVDFLSIVTILHYDLLNDFINCLICKLLFIIFIVS